MVEWRFDFIKVRLEGKKIHIVNENDQNKIPYHLTKITGFLQQIKKNVGFFR